MLYITGNPYPWVTAWPIFNAVLVSATFHSSCSVRDNAPLGSQSPLGKGVNVATAVTPGKAFDGRIKFVSKHCLLYQQRSMKGRVTSKSFDKRTSSRRHTGANKSPCWNVVSWHISCSTTADPLKSPSSCVRMSCLLFCEQQDVMLSAPLFFSFLCACAFIEP